MIMSIECRKTTTRVLEASSLGDSGGCTFEAFKAFKLGVCACFQSSTPPKVEVLVSGET
jgi:hypothetical protein